MLLALALPSAALRLKTMFGELRVSCDLVGLSAIAGWAKVKLFGRAITTNVRIPELPCPVKLRVGTSDCSVLKQVILEREYEFPEGFWPKTIIDAGANIGITSALFATSFPSARIFALEPEPSNFGLLQDNSEPYQNITAIRGAIWDHSGIVRIAVSKRGGYWAARVGEGNIDARAYTVDELMRMFCLDSIDLLKIDVETAEVEVLSTSDRWIDKVEMLAIETHDRLRPGCSAALERVAHRFPHRWKRGELDFLSRHYLRPPTAPTKIFGHAKAIVPMMPD